MSRTLHRLLIISLILGLFLPVFGVAQEAGQGPKIPETFDEILVIMKKFLDFFPQTLKSAWQEAVAIWQKMADWFLNLWNFKIWPQIEGIWHKILSLFGKEVEKRKEIIQEELEKEKQETKEEIKTEAEKAGKTLWQKIKDIIPGI